jgi:hypothetical protein
VTHLRWETRGAVGSNEEGRSTCWAVGVPVWKVRVTSVVPSVYCPPESRSTKSPPGESALAVSTTAR